MGAAELNGEASLRTSRRFKNFCLAFIGVSVIPKGVEVDCSENSTTNSGSWTQANSEKTQVDDKQIQSRLKFGMKVVQWCPMFEILIELLAQNGWGINFSRAQTLRGRHGFNIFSMHKWYFAKPETLLPPTKAKYSHVLPVTPSSSHSICIHLRTSIQHPNFWHISLHTAIPGVKKQYCSREESARSVHP